MRTTSRCSTRPAASPRARCPPARRAGGASTPTDEALPPFWDELAALGWLGLAVPEADGGEGYGFAELAVVLEELGRAGAPGPFLPTVWASAAIHAGGGDARSCCGAGRGRAVGSVGLGPALDGDARRATARSS